MLTVFTMLDLEVLPERSLGNEQWEFVLGEKTVTVCCQFYVLGNLNMR